MKFLVLAIDFDGTAARDGVLDPAVRAAIDLLRSSGIVVVLVTGRILGDLRASTGDLNFVDAVVAENGAVVYLPDSDTQSTLGEAPPDVLLNTLKAERIPFATGRVVLEAQASDATRILDILRRLELPLMLAFNRGRVMALPQSISKATGLRHVLGVLRLSPHNAVAIGDAENDHELLRSCELAVAVAWGSPALKAVADFVVEGTGPASVAEYLTTLVKRHRLPTPLGTRRRLTLGRDADGKPFSLSVRGRNVLVAGDPKSGKSWVTGLMCEQLILYGYSLCIIDPEGDYVSLEALPGVRVLGGADPLPRPRDLLRALRHADVSVVIDLSHVPYEHKRTYIRNLLPALASFRRRSGLPHRIVVDEAHYFLHDPDILQLLDLELNGYTLVSYRSSRLHPGLLAATSAIVVTRESDPAEVRALRELCVICRESAASGWEPMLGNLGIGEAAVLPITDEAHGKARRLHLAPRMTSHVRHLAKYIDLPVAESRAFVFWHGSAPTSLRARTLQEFVQILDRSSLPALAGHLSRGDFSRWITDVFGDYHLARTVQAIEVGYRRGRLQDVLRELAGAVRARYEFDVVPAQTGERHAPARVPTRTEASIT